MTGRLELEFHGTERFEVLRQLGKGGMGIVYEALDRETGSRMALKTLWRMDAHALYRFKNEFRLLQDIQHPNLVRLGELVCKDDVWFFTMEYIDGVNFITFVRPEVTLDSELGHLIDTQPLGREQQVRRRPSHQTEEITGTGEFSDSDSLAKFGFHEKRLRDSARQLAQGLMALHRANRVHRDIKPTNIMVTQEGRVVLLDFGLVTDIQDDDKLATVSRVVGTASYMAPEQARSQPVGPEADWYSFGMVLYKAMVGNLPFRGTYHEIMMEKQQLVPPPPREFFPEIPHDLDMLCSELVRIDPKLRPPEERILALLGVPSEPYDIGTASSLLHSIERTPFVGRQWELAELRSAFEEIRSGVQVTVFIQGESGLGKSEIVRRFTQDMKQEDSELVVLKSRCFERESVPYNAFDGIADALSQFLMRLDRREIMQILPSRADLLPLLFPVLRRVEVIAEQRHYDYSVIDPQRLRTRMFEAFRNMLINLTERYLLIFVIDDFQWARADSLMLISELLHAPDAPPLLLLATERTEGPAEEHVAPEAPDTFRLTGDVRYLHLEPLTPEMSRSLVEMLLPKVEGDREAIINRIVEESGGHPLFIQELVRHLESKGGKVTGAMRLEDALMDRIEQLPKSALRLLEVISIAGVPVAQETAAMAAEMDFDEFAKWVALLRVAFLVRTGGARGTDTIETFHDRINEAVLSRAGTDKRRFLHSQMAFALEQAGAAKSDPNVLVTHFKLAGEKERAAWHAAEAGQRAIASLAFNQAADLYRIALDLGRHDADQKRDIQQRLADALMRSGRGVESAEVLIEVAAEAEPALQLECERQAAEQLLLSGRVDQGLEAIRRILSSMGADLPGTQTRALLSLLWRRFKVRLRGIQWHEKTEDQIPRAALMRIDVLNAGASGLAMVDTVRGMDFQARGLLTALKTGETSRIVRAMAYEASFLASQGRRSLPRARRLLSRCQRAAERSKKPFLFAWTVGVDGILCYFEGRFHTGADLLAEAENMFIHEVTTESVAWELNNVRLFLVWSLMHGGAYSRLCSLFDQYIRDAERRGDLFASTSIIRSGNLAWLIRGAPGAARRDLKRAAWKPPEGTFHLHHWWEIEALSLIALYEGSALGALEQLAPRFQSFHRSLTSRTQIVRGLAHAAQGRLALASSTMVDRPEPYLGLASQLARRLAKAKMSYTTVWAELLWAGIGVQTGELDRGMDHLGRAIDIADKHDLPAYAAAARKRLGELLGGEVGDKLVVRASTWMDSEGIKEPDRLLEVLAPGFNRA